jgi:hypothetical protein
MEVSSPSFPKTKISSTIQNEPQLAKNKKVKSQEAIPYLTLVLKGEMHN